MTQLDAAAFGIVSSVITSILTLIPFLGATSMRRAIVTIIVIILVFVAQGFTYQGVMPAITYFATVVVYALATYKAVLQPIVVPAATGAIAALRK